MKWVKERKQRRQPEGKGGRKKRGTQGLEKEVSVVAETQEKQNKF